MLLLYHENVYLIRLHDLENYCRVNTKHDDQQGSLELQIRFYTDSPIIIKAQANNLNDKSSCMIHFFEPINEIVGLSNILDSKLMEEL